MSFRLLIDRYFFPFSAGFSLLLFTLYHGGIPYVATLAFLGTAFALFFFAIVLNAAQDLSRSRIRTFVGYFFLVFLVWLMAMFFSVAPTYGAEDFNIFFSSLAIFFGVAILQKGSFNEDHYATILFVAALFATLPGFLFFVELAQPRFFGLFGDTSYSFNAAPNAYADFILLALPVSGALLFKSSGWRWPLVSFVFSLLCAGFFLSLSRGAFLALTGVFVFAGGIYSLSWRIVFLRKIYESRKFFLKILLTAFLTISLVWCAQAWRLQQFPLVSLEDKLTQTADEGAASRDDRLDFWTGSLELIREKPWFGSGPASFSFVYPQIQDRFGALSWHPHNVFLKWGVEQGVVFLGLVATGLFAACAYAFYRLFFMKTASIFSHAVFWGLVTVLLHQMIDYNLNFSSISFGLAVGLGLLCRPFFQQKSLPHSTTKAFLWEIWVLTVFMGMVFVFGVREFVYKMDVFRGMEALNQGDVVTALVHFEQAEPLFWEENLRLLWSEALLKEGDPLQAVELLKDSPEVEHLAPFALQLGLAYESLGGVDSQWFLKALNLDRHNQIEYHYHAYRFGLLSAQELYQTIRAFSPILARNEHNTVLSKNPEFVAKSYELLKLNSKIERAQLEKDEAEFLAIWAEERAKFSRAFNIDL